MSKARHVLRVIGPESSRHLLNQSYSKLERIVIWALVFSRLLRSTPATITITIRHIHRWHFMKWSNIKRELTADKTSPASIPPAKKIKKRKKIIIRIYHLTKSIYSSVVRNSFSCLIVLLAAVWSPELGLYIFLFVWCVCWFVFLSYWSVSGRFGSGRKREGRLTWVENRKEVWVG